METFHTHAPRANTSGAGSARAAAWLALTINRSPDYQINYGTGKDVSVESIADAQQPLVVQWLGESTVTIPISR